MSKTGLPGNAGDKLRGEREWAGEGLLVPV